MADLSLTAANVVAGTGAAKSSGTFGETVTQGETVYLKSSDGRLWKADANVSAAEAAVRGIALNGGSAGQPAQILRSGPVTIGATVAVGQVYAQSTNAGKICPYSDLSTGHYPTVLGIATSTTVIEVLILAGGVAKA